MKQKIILQFKIELLDSSPTIWRRIQVPENYSFWDLHIAIQDSMGWLDYHLHQFMIKQPHKRKYTVIGIPFDENDTLAGWDIKISDYFRELGINASYEYDFGDGWEHKITLEGKFLAEKGIKYPICTKGERACPPEDCGGPMGYDELLDILSDKKHPSYDDMIS
ncbi:plasmid pRiA4b ORF-3 family protein, partial [Pasteurella atlantica]